MTSRVRHRTIDVHYYYSKFGCNNFKTLLGSDTSELENRNHIKKLLDSEHKIVSIFEFKTQSFFDIVMILFSNNFMIFFRFLSSKANNVLILLHYYRC